MGRWTKFYGLLLSVLGLFVLLTFTRASADASVDQWERLLTEDFLLNDDTTGGYCPQIYPAVASLPGEKHVVCWIDLRETYSRVYAQIYDSLGQPEGPNFRVSEIGVHYDQAACVEADHSGNFTVTWTGAGYFGQSHLRIVS